ncbi:MAG: preprotein translocase subunit SecG [Bacteroidales bacterium]|jgi:preprotein translocase subunit SecG|nr:preprotein translocase subunit SecG [Bacteroidales bacterium]
MKLFFTILVVLIVIAAILLTLVVLLQNGKGEGLATNFTAANQALGVRQAASSLEKATWTLVAVIGILSIASTLTLTHSSGNAEQDAISTEILNQQPAEAPAFPTAPVQQADPTAE